MSENRDGKGNIILKILIAILAVVLIYVIVAPWNAKQEHLGRVKETRKRMELVRNGLIYYMSQTGNYPASLNEFVDYMKNNPQILAKKDSIFQIMPGTRINLDSLSISVVAGQQFIYENNETSPVKFYYLRCPGGSGAIGSKTLPDSANKATWE